jgi:hypothetical protein
MTQSAVVGVAASLMMVAGLSTAAAGQADGRAWLALGDSYSSGEGIPGTNDVANAEAHQGRDCQRATGDGTGATAWSVSARGTVSEQLGISDFVLVACTGATTGELATQIGEAEDRLGRDRWDLVTFSIGGNDIGFADVLKGCLDADNLPWSAFDPSPGCDVNEAELRRRVDELRRTLTTTYDLIASRVNPGGDVVVLGYPHLVEETARWDRWRRGVIGNCEGIQSYDVGTLRSATGYLNEQIALAVSDADGRHGSEGIHFHFLDISQDPYEFNDDPGSRHALCSADPWLNGQTASVTSGDWRIERSFHPTQVGHDNTGRVLTTLLEGIRLDDPPSAPLPGDENGQAMPLICRMFEEAASGESGIWPLGNDLELYGGTLHGPFVPGEPFRLIVLSSSGESIQQYTLSPDGVTGPESFGPEGPPGLPPAEYEFVVGTRGVAINTISDDERVCGWFL